MAFFYPHGYFAAENGKTFEEKVLNRIIILCEEFKKAVHARRNKEKLITNGIRRSIAQIGTDEIPPWGKWRHRKHL